MTDKKSFSKIEELITNLMQQTKIPGLSIKVIQEDKEIYSAAFGARSLEDNKPVTLDTIFGIGSITKSITTLAIMQLHEQGKLDINDPISKYLPLDIGMKDKPITIYHLMTHSSGIPNLGVAEALLYRHTGLKETYLPISSFDDAIRHINGAKNEVIDEPEKRYFYFNAGFLILGLIIEKVTEIKYEDYVREAILKPLKMNRSIFTKEEFDKDKNKLAGYTFWEGKLTHPTYPIDPFIFSAGGLFTSVNEMANYLTMLLNDGNFEGKELISSESLKLLFKGNIERQPSFFGKEEYASGWAVTEDFFGELMVHHGGSVGTSSAYLALIPKKKIGVIIMGNTGNSQGGLISQAIIAKLLGKDPLTDHPILRMDSKLKQLAGDYQTYKGITKLTIVKKGLTLYGKLAEDECVDFAIIPENDDPDDFHFYVPNGANKFPVEFLVDKKKDKIIYMHERNAYHKIK